MKLMIELDREVDGRWIAEVPELNVLLYGNTKQDAIQRAPVGSAGNCSRPDRSRRVASRFGRCRIRHCRMSSWPSAKARRVFAARVAPRPYGGFPQDHEKGRMGGLPILVSRFRGTRPGNPRESVKDDRPSTQRFVIVPAHAKALKAGSPCCPMPCTGYGFPLLWGYEPHTFSRR